MAARALASRQELTLADLEGEPVLDTPTRRRTTSAEEKFELIASGHGIALVPLSVARTYSRPDLTHIPVTDLPSEETCLVTPTTTREPRVLAFLHIATTALRSA